VPSEESFPLQYIIETLFVVQCEPKLNMICPMGTDPQQRYGLPYDQQWYTRLHHQAVTTMHSITYAIGRINQLRPHPLD
jgi:hypothetical protein